MNLSCSASRIFLILLQILLSSCTTKCYKMDVMKAVNKNILTDDLALLAINDPRLACPKFAQGDTSLCGPNLQVSDAWNADLPDRVLFSMFYGKTQYQRIKDNFQDKDFLRTIRLIPSPDSVAMNWFNKRKDYLVSFLPIDEERLNEDEIDTVQLKMITVFHAISSWTFCPQIKYDGSYYIHGKYNSTKKEIMLFRTACGAGNIYGSNIRSLARTYRYYFIGSHELGHVIDDLSGQLDNSDNKRQILSEQRANLYGLIITRGISRLFNARFEMYKNVLDTIGPNLLKKCDRQFLDFQVKRWSNVNEFFDQLVINQKKEIKSRVSHKTLKNEWTSWGCIEKANR